MELQTSTPRRDQIRKLARKLLKYQFWLKLDRSRRVATPFPLNLLRKASWVSYKGFLCRITGPVCLVIRLLANNRVKPIEVKHGVPLDELQRREVSNGPVRLQTDAKYSQEQQQRNIFRDSEIRVFVHVDTRNLDKRKIFVQNSEDL